MKLRRPPPPFRAVINVTALCDIMLCLLIFFMLVSKAGIDTGADRKLELPVARLGVTDEQIESEMKAGSILVINVDPAGPARNPRVYGKFYSTGKPFSFTVTDAQSGAANLAEFVRAVKSDRADFVVAVHAAAGTPFYNVEPVLQAINTAEPSQVRFAFHEP